VLRYRLFACFSAQRSRSLFLSLYYGLLLHICAIALSLPPNAVLFLLLRLLQLLKLSSMTMACDDLVAAALNLGIVGDVPSLSSSGVNSAKIITSRTVSVGARFRMLAAVAILSASAELVPDMMGE
jgi:hypothetical protein